MFGILIAIITVAFGIPNLPQKECDCSQEAATNQATQAPPQSTQNNGECSFCLIPESPTSSLASTTEETVTKNLNMIVLPNEDVYLTTPSTSAMATPSNTKKKRVFIFNFSRASDGAIPKPCQMTPTQGVNGAHSQQSQFGGSRNGPNNYREYTMRQSQTDTSFHEITKTVFHKMTPTIALIRNNYFTIRATKIIIKAPPPIITQRRIFGPPRVILRPYPVTHTVTMTKFIPTCLKTHHHHEYLPSDSSFEWSQQAQEKHHRHPMIPMPPLQVPVPTECHHQDPNDVLPKANNV
jgi:hypothetical protein